METNNTEILTKYGINIPDEFESIYFYEEAGIDRLIYIRIDIKDSQLASFLLKSKLLINPKSRYFGYDKFSPEWWFDLHNGIYLGGGQKRTESGGIIQTQVLSSENALAAIFIMIID